MASNFADEFDGTLDPVFDGVQLGYRVLSGRPVSSGIQQWEQIHDVSDVGFCKAFQSLVRCSLPLE